MVLGFLRHVFQYFKPTIPIPSGKQTSEHIPPFDLATAIPIIDPQTGKITAYIRGQPDPMISPRAPDSFTQKTTASQKSESSDEILYSRNSAGHFIPVSSQAKASTTPTVQSHVKIEHSQGKPFRPIPGDAGEDWDGWPDGPFIRDFTWGEWEATGHLRVHWATKMGGGYKGDVNAAHWKQGKKTTRQCLGFIMCNNRQCQVLTRPNTTAAGRTRQLQLPCQCGANLEYHTCPVRSEITRWSEGVHYENGGVHNHARLTHILSLLPKEQAEFQALVENHPDAGPLKMIVGVPGLKGPGKSVADISPVLLNADRVSKEKQRVKQGVSLQGGDNFVSTFAKFDREHPGFVIHSILGDVTVISCQSQFMSSQLVKDDPIDGPLNGMVSDAAHGWWQERTSLLIVSSIYCPNLFCWVPGIFSYSNGASAQHYKYHFYALLESIAAEAGPRGIKLIDLLFLGVMDFSEAEREGFILAFIEFWRQRNDPRTEKELREAAEKLLRGCEEHFAANVTRIKRLSGVVSPELADDFQSRTLALLDLEDADQFAIEAAKIIRDFPNAKSWLDWWMRPSHAKMLFASQRVMDPFIWDSIPSTTNAEESMHWKLYAATGRNHSLLEGFYSLVAVATYYERRFQAANVGTPHRYGRPEPWKLTKATIGRTKKSRTPRSPGKRKKNDGRPPDTAKELLLNPKKTKSPTPRRSTCSKTPVSSSHPSPAPTSKAPAQPAPKKTVHRAKKSVSFDVSSPFIPSPTPPPAIEEFSYRWKQNSCWLDASLEVVYRAISRDFASYAFASEEFPEPLCMRTLYQMLDWRHISTPRLDSKALGKKLGEDRDMFRKAIVTKKLVSGTELNHEDSPFGWLWGLLWESANLRDISKTYQGHAYFEQLTLSLHICSGNPSIGGRHVEIIAIPVRKTSHQLNRNLHKVYHGSVTDWFNDELAIDRDASPHRHGCWRVCEGESLCDGQRQDLGPFIISLPVIYVIEVGDDRADRYSISWNFPETLDPPSLDTAQRDDIVYDLVGIIFASEDHFIARYVSEFGTRVYDYDSIKYNGACIEDIEATIGTHLAGKHIPTPPGFRVFAAVYHLRGGTDAQDAFFDIRRGQLQNKYQIQLTKTTLDTLPSALYSDPTLIEMNPDDRTWMLSPRNARGIEYVSPHGKYAMPKSISKAASPDAGHEHLGDGPESEDEPLVDNPLSPHAQSIPDASAAPPSSDTESAFAFNCRCGLKGVGQDVFNGERDGLAIRCDECGEWSHLACQENGRASRLGVKEPFVCDGCDVHHWQYGGRTSERLGTKVLTNNRLPLKDRLREGTGALAMYGRFAYPVRLVKYDKETRAWLVQWWRGCVFEQSGIIAGSVTEVHESRIRDSLWANRTARRLVRLGYWHLACNASTWSDELREDPSRTKYTKEIHEVLAPHLTLLKRLYNSPDDVKTSLIPAKQYLELKKTAIPPKFLPSGGISALQEGGIGNWIEAHITKDKKFRHRWMGRVLQAHCHTLFIADQLAASESHIHTPQQLLRRAWEVQASKQRDGLEGGIDINRECVSTLEKLMFEQGKVAGIAGNWQWGLDAGDHQENWCPYNHVPDSWNHRDRDSESESEAQRGHGYVEWKDPNPPKKNPRPTPRPVHSKKSVEPSKSATSTPK